MKTVTQIPSLFAVRYLMVLVWLALFPEAGWAQPVAYVGLDGPVGQIRLINSDGTGDRLLPVALPGPAFPSSSKDGRFLALTSQTPGRPSQLSQNVFLLNLMTGQLSQITQLEDSVSGTNFVYYLPWYHALSPDSTRIAIWSFVRVLNGTTPILQTWRVADGLLQNLIAANRVRTGFTQGGDGVDWHPTQNLLVYTLDLDVPIYDYDSGAYLGPGEGAALFVTPPGGAAVQLTFPRGFRQVSLNRILLWAESDYAPAFSPNGQQVAYVRATYISDSAAPGLRQPSYLSLRTVNLDGSNDHPVLNFAQGAYVTRVSWSRNGTQLVYDAGQQATVSGGSANAVVAATDELWIANTNGTGVHKLRSAAAGFPVWTPAGTTFCNLPGIVLPGGAAGSVDDCGPPITLQLGRTTGGQFRLDVNGGTPNLLYRILAATNVTSWQTIGTLPRTNTTTSFVDTGGSTLSRRFYRVVLGN